MRRVNKATVEMIKGFESFRSEPYLDIAGVPTIGYGTTNGITMDTAPITEEEAEEFLMEDIGLAESAVSKYIRTSLTDNQFGALVSLVYNVGNGPLIGTIGRLLNNVVQPDYAGAADGFLAWNKARVRGILQPVAGLTKRRHIEREFFLEN